MEWLSSNAIRIEVFLYPSSTIPVIRNVIDPSAIMEDKGKDNGNGKDTNDWR
ncbi:MAG: hypothetical protein P1U77_00215 [Rubripirellula sp.]|nr:hypothetical protein [Rubripirellula sp.]